MSNKHQNSKHKLSNTNNNDTIGAQKGTSYKDPNAIFSASGIQKILGVYGLFSKLLAPLGYGFYCCAPNI